MVVKDRARYCVNGHDTLKVGRTSTRRCKECKRVQDTIAARARRNGTHRLPTRPLQQIIQHTADRHATSKDKGLTYVAELYAHRHGITLDSARKRLWYLRRSRYVQPDNADQWAVALGMHPSEIWGDGWWT